METLTKMLAMSAQPGATAPVTGPGELFEDRPASSEAIALSPDPHEAFCHRLDGGDLHKRLTTGDGLADVATPFAAVTTDQHGSTLLATDVLGLRQLYGVRGEGWSAAGTSARRLARLKAGPGKRPNLDRTALGIYRLVGFHLGEATAFEHVQTLPAAHLWTLSHGSLAETCYQDPEPVRPFRVEQAVREYASMMRRTMERLLDEFPDAELQLSGGLDSRLLLAAIPAARRASLATVTLSSSGSKDETVARRLAEKYGMKRQVIDLDRLTDLSPADIHTLVHNAALRHEQVVSPLQLAMLDWVEAQTSGEPRIDGLGAECTRGMYHSLQRPHPRPTPQLVERLARWRIFSRGQADSACLAPDFAAESQEAALRRLKETFASYEMDWLSATDHFWSTVDPHRSLGPVETAACRSRTVLAPYLQPSFLTIGAGLPARAKSGSRFNARVLAELDPELAAIPMDTGVRPVELTSPRPVAVLRTGRDYTHRVSAKLRQRIAGRGVSDAVSTTLTRGLTRHWRAHPELLEPVAATGLLDQDWLAGLLNGKNEPAPATASFISLLEAATSIDTDG
jgi:asparagine synthase (glutamine-hydrolysing)